jgi:hypothetical protein
VKIKTLVEYRWNTAEDRYILVREEGYDYVGPVALCKGASSQQNALAASQTAFYGQMTADTNKQFAGQTAILDSLNKSFAPIIAAGPSQNGFSQGETNDLNSSAIQGTAQQYNAAQKQLQTQQAAAGGGNQFLPSGVNAQEAGTLASAGANQTSSELLGIKQAGYTQGANQYQSAISGEEQAAGLYNPASYSGAATGAGNAAAGELNTINQENTAASPWTMIGGILGGAASAGLGIATGGLSTAIGGGLSALGGGGQSSGAANGWT